MSAVRRHWLVLAAAAVAAALSFKLRDLFPFGSFHDDAIYWLLSKSIPHGAYTVASDPAGATVTNYLPGYPLLLALVSWTDSVAAARLLSWLLTFGTAALGWDLFRRWFGPRTAAWATAWLLLQPLALRYSGTVMSDPAAMFLTALAFWIHLAADRDSAKADAALALVVGYSCLVRPAGVLLAAAILLDSFFRGRFRRTAAVAAGLALFQGGLIFWSARHGQPASAFLGQWKLALEGAPVPVVAAVVWRNFRYYAEVVAFAALLPLGKWAAAVPAALRAALAAALIVVALRGLWLDARSARRSLALFFALNAGMLLAWLRPDPRYLLPALFPLVHAAVSALSNRPAPGEPPALSRKVLVGILAALVLSVMLSARAAVAPRAALPVQAFDWLRQNVAPGGVIGAASSSTVYVHTGRRCVDFLPTYAPEDLVRRLIDRGVTHLLLGPAEGVGTPDPNDWTPQVRRVAAHAAWFRSERAWPDGYEIFSVALDPARFRAADDLRREGSIAVAAGDAARGETLLRKALELQPDLPGAHDQLAKIAAFSKDYPEAAARLEGALALWPGDPLLGFHLYLVQASRRMPAPDLRRLEQSARESAYWPLLWRILVEERRVEGLP